MTNESTTRDGELQTIELDPPTRHVLVELIDTALQDDILVEEPREYAAFGRLLSSLETAEKPSGELTEGVKQNTVLDGLPGHIYQEMLFEYYEQEVRRPEETDNY